MVNVLIIEDNIFYAKKLMDYINRSHEIKVSNIVLNGKEAINFLNHRNDIDVFLLDLKIPKYNGIEILDMINEEKREKYKKSCIVISGEIEYINKLRKNEMIYAVLQKVLTFEEITNKILELVHEKEQIRLDENLERKIKEEILYLGYNISHKGTLYLIETIKYISENKIEQINNLKEEIYPYIALINNTTVHNVKCNIARATENMYYNCESERLKGYFKFQELKKPSIKNIIQMILYKLEETSIFI